MALLLATGMLAAGCGDDSDDSGDGGGTSSSAPAATTESAPADTTSSEGGGAGTKVSLTDFAIDPKDGTVKAGDVTFDVVNDGQVPHALEIEGNGVEEVSATLSSNGDTDTLSVNLEPGEYEWYCPIGDHRDQGMEGTLTVE